ncbi:MAG: tryptophan-rich sensory protein [Candidatus Brennerbacteria bacterium]|nr:tryptophan-rich sensory protein [Candidatus Brennerbacteria bacterium]
MNIRKGIALVVAVGASLLAGAIGSIFTASSVSLWYPTLMKPALNPPSWVFGPVWTVLYVLMGIAAFLVWRQGWERRDVKDALKIFALQLVLNALWSVLFFGLQSPLLALVGIVLLWGAILWVISAFARISRPAAWLLVLYLAWVTFATYLNAAIWLLN